MNKLMPRQAVPDLEVPLVSGGAWRLADQAPDYAAVLADMAGVLQQVALEQPQALWSQEQLSLLQPVEQQEHLRPGSTPKPPTHRYHQAR